jgi:glyoxylase-like metal-dependent hydrolase (beta-lactamase superfamily II)
MNEVMHAGPMPADVQQDLERELAHLDVPARPIVVPTPWDVGPVSAYLFPGEPVTLIDSAVNTAEGRDAIAAALAAEGLKPSDVARVIVTHAHTDHFGGAVWLQEESGCEVLAHPADIAVSDPARWGENARATFGPLGFDEDLIGALFSHEGSFDFRAPAFTPVADGDVLMSGGRALRIEHHPGHSPGHLWVIDEPSGAIFTGDYVLADHPTNAGLEVDPDDPTGRAPLLAQYNNGLRELMARQAPALFPGHGPPITNHRGFIERRLNKTDRRTRHVLGALDDQPRSALNVGRKLYGARAEQSWEIMSDLAGRLDLLSAEGRASSYLGDDGVWYFTV